jgi:hypothetical protein
VRDGSEAAANHERTRPLPDEVLFGRLPALQAGDARRPPSAFQQIERISLTFAHLARSEKDELDECYVRHASLLLDLRIIMMTLRVLIRGQSRPDGAAANARSPRNLSREAAPLREQFSVRGTCGVDDR